MPRPKLLEALRTQCQLEIEAIEARARQRSQDIIEAAREEGLSGKYEILHQADRAIEKRRGEILQQARMEAMKTIGAARGEMAERVLSQVEKRLRQVRQRANYPDFLKSQAQAAANSLGDDGPIRFQADARDRDVLEGWLQAKGIEAETAYDIETWGGLIAASHDGRIEIDSRMEARLAQVEESIRDNVIAWLSESEPVLTGNQEAGPRPSDPEFQQGRQSPPARMDN
ncbi:MAG: V-type ATP synthase subunit E [Anaerolineales bacterium]